MKIGILTFHCAINYGAILQAFCLQEYLKSKGHEVKIINYRPTYLKQQSPFLSRRGIRSYIREFILIPVRLLRNLRFRKFEYKYLNTSFLDFNFLVNDYDVFLFGSDQIWNPLITKGLDSIYFGQFLAAKNKKKVAYAASCGSLNNIKENEWNILSSYVNQMDLVGVREFPLQKKLESLLQRSIEVVLDPVLLFGNDAFESINLPKIKSKNYLLIFAICGDDKTLKFGHQIAQILNLNVIELVASKEYVMKNNVVQTASPLKFVSYFKNADYIVTSSFHGTAFSLLFNKDFNFVSPNPVIGERVSVLLKLLKLDNRILIDKTSAIETSSINYLEVNLKLDQLRDSSKSFLSKI